MLSRKADPISDERCPVLLVSGHGWRPGPALARQLNREYRVEIADQSALPRLLQQLARIDGPCHLIGHAHGSVPALQAALARPQQLLSLTLVNPAAFSLLRQLHDWESWEAASRFASHVIALHAAGATALAARSSSSSGSGASSGGCWDRSRKASCCAGCQASSMNSPTFTAMPCTPMTCCHCPCLCTLSAIVRHRSLLAAWPNRCKR
ncbi:alpha/beta fold hydrolase [Marinobacterium aestuariivivens]|uniref:Alpha/beta fold hydrolase n=1 Tax=Marinobacterium aestuariivivens TaxID=1698799 RepID=A0ABW1ZZC9_9GAMM